MLAAPLPASPPPASEPSLEDLIPDSAVDNPEAWAVQGAPADAVVESALEVDPNSPLAEVPAIDVPWPDDLVLPQLAPLEPDDSIQFADMEDAANPRPALLDADVVQVTDELALAFPPDDAAFPEKEAFAARYGRARQRQGQRRAARRARQG